MEIYRKCVGCGKLKLRKGMLKLTKNYLTGKVILNPHCKVFGRSAYLCYNQNCIETALKKNRLGKALKTNEDWKGILDGQFKG